MTKIAIAKFRWRLTNAKIFTQSNKSNEKAFAVVAEPRTRNFMYLRGLAVNVRLINSLVIHEMPAAKNDEREESRPIHNRSIYFLKIARSASQNAFYRFFLY